MSEQEDDDQFITSDMKDGDAVFDDEDYNSDRDSGSDWDLKKGQSKPTRKSSRKVSRKRIIESDSDDEFFAKTYSRDSPVVTSRGRVIKPVVFEEDDGDVVRSAPKRKPGRPAGRPPFRTPGPKSATKQKAKSPMPKDRCNICGLVLKTDKMVAEHIRDDHVLPSMNPDDMVIEKTGVKAFLCSICDTSFEARIKIKFHKRSKHNISTTPEDDELNIECNLCESILENPTMLNQHMDSKHVYLKTYHCDYCSEKYFEAALLVSHRRIMHEVNNVIEGTLKVQPGNGSAVKNSFPKRVMEDEELPPSSPEKSGGNTSSSDYEPGRDKEDDDEEFVIGSERKATKKLKKKKKGSSSSVAAIEKLGLQGLSAEGLEGFKKAPPHVQKKVLKELQKRVKSGKPSAASGSSDPTRLKKKKKHRSSVGELTSKLSTTLQKLLEKKKKRLEGKIYDCPKCPHRFRSQGLLERHKKSAHPNRPAKPVFTGTCQLCSDPIPDEKDYIQHLMSKHMTAEVDVLSVAADILVKKVASNSATPYKLPKGKVRKVRKVKTPSKPDTEDVNSNDTDRTSYVTKTTIEVVQDD